MKEIILNNSNLKAIVDDEDYDKVIEFCDIWYLNKAGYVQGIAKNIFYIETKKRVAVFLHQVVMDLERSWLKLDHKDRNKLNCQKENLRIATKSQNAFNVLKSQNCLSKFKGVTFHKGINKWEVKTMRNGILYRGGYHVCEIIAARHANVLIQQLHGEFAVLNDIKKICQETLQHGCLLEPQLFV